MVGLASVLACAAPTVEVPSEALLIRAREVLEGAEASPRRGEVEARLCAWNRGPRVCASGRGATMTNAVELAAATLGELESGDRLGVDVVLPDGASEDVAWRPDGTLATAAELLVVRARDPLLVHEVAVASWIESLDGTPLRLRDGWPAAVQLERADVESRARAAAAWLAASVQDDGRFLYERHPGEPPSDDYNWLRHAGATAVLFHAAAQLEHPAWGQAATRALEALLAHATPLDDTLVVVDDGKAKLGGGGLALVAFAKHHAWSGDDRFLPKAQALGRGLLAAQAADGSFQAFRTPEGELLEGTSLYYPGEAILGLAELAAWDGSSTWLDAAEQGVRHLATSREHLAVTDLPADHWLMIAQDRLHALGRDDAIEGMDRLADAIRIGPWPRSTNAAATRLEGLFARVETCARSGALCPMTRMKTLDGLTELLKVQLTRESGFFLPDDELIGAFPASPDDLTCRIDTTQHALSVLLGALRDVAL